MAKILYAGNFNIRDVDERCQKGENPSHHLHAVPELRRHGHEVDVLGREPEETLSKWAFQRLVRKAAMGYDALIAHNLVEINALAALRMFKLFPVPILAFVHSVSDRSVQKLTARGADRLLVLNRKAQDTLKSVGVPESRIRFFDFGADLSFYQPMDLPSEFVLSVGVSQRDHGTLIEAARSTGLPVVIVGRLSDAEVSQAPSNVTVLSQGNYDLSFERLVDLYRRARVVVVSHHGSDHPFGLNAVVEALAMGRPVIMTKGRGIDIEPDAMGFGASVAPHDVDALASAMRELYADDARIVAYGRKARELAEQRFNTKRMTHTLLHALEEVL